MECRRLTNEHETRDMNKAQPPQPWRRVVAFCLLATAPIGAAVDGVGTDDLPKVWTWTPPTGTAAGHPSIRPLCRIPVSPSSRPLATADAVCNFILDHGLAEGDVAILLQGFGRGTLVGHPSDALSDTGLPEDLQRGTPWTLHGLTETSEWVDAFIARYQVRQSEDGVPAPHRFHMDSELRRPALCYLPDVSPCWSELPLQVFEAMQSDPRWATEPLHMNPGGVPTFRTMAELYESGGSPSFDPSQPRDAQVNRDWSIWWDGATREAVDGALALALYDRVESAWTGVRCSEFAQSMRLDAETEPDGSRRVYHDFEWWNEGWMTSAWSGHADLQAPAMYVFGETFIDPDQPFMNEQIRLHRKNLDACIHSFGGTAPASITPWITLPDRQLPFGEDPPTTRAYTLEEFRQILALVRSRGIVEFQLWPNATTDTWEAVAATIDEVWIPSATHVVAAIGGISNEPLPLLSVADRQSCSITPTAKGFDLRVTIDTGVASDCAQTARLELALEAMSDAESTWFIEYGTGDGHWFAIQEVQVGPIARFIWTEPQLIPDRFDASGNLLLRIRSDSTSPAAIDLVQTAVRSSRLGDFNEDGLVDGADLGVWLLNAGEPCDPSTVCPADLDGDGEVAGGDLGILLSAWGSCG